MTYHDIKLSHKLKVDMIVWNEVIGHEGYLDVSNCGKVRTLDKDVKNWPRGTRTIKGRVLSNNWLRNGYPSVSIDGRSTYVHRLVADAFVVGRTIERYCVNHIDGNKKNNNFKNLEWVTKKENSIHASKTGLLLFSKSITRSPDDLGVCMFYPQITKVIEDGYSRTGVSNCLSGLSKSSAGFKWNYCERA